MKTIKILTFMIVAMLIFCFLIAEETSDSQKTDMEMLTISGELQQNKNQWFLKTEQEMIFLDFGPKEFLQQKKVELKPADSFQITGFQEGSTFLVVNFLHRDSLIILRDEFGEPLWSTEKPTNPHYVVDASKCIGCRLCVNNCPVDAIEFKNGKAVIDAEKCINCGICKVGNRSNYKGCPVDAIDSNKTK